MSDVKKPESQYTTPREEHENLLASLNKARSNLNDFRITLKNLMKAKSERPLDGVMNATQAKTDQNNMDNYQKISAKTEVVSTSVNELEQQAETIKPKPSAEASTAPNGKRFG